MGILKTKTNNCLRGRRCEGSQAAEGLGVKRARSPPFFASRPGIGSRGPDLS